ncbi:MAG: hypothetical protein KAU94_12935, partial [Verrucomicrobia bacterium]|nr:hypothetical protein [Verrucomicrobiota bacterium]
MKRRTKLEVVAACGFILWCSSAIAAPATNLVYQLLDQYVSAPDWREQPAERLVPVEFKEPGNEDAPHATTALLKKWESKCKEYRHSGPITDDPELTPAIQNRLLEGCTSHPEYLPILLDVLIKSSATYDSVFSILQKNEAQEIYTQAETDAIKQWLMVRSKYFRDDLVREAKSIHFDGEYLQKEEALQQLSELDWDTAKPLLEINAQNNEPHV